MEPTKLYSETRPWGSFTHLFEGKGTLVKALYVAPGKRLSDQRHAHRRELWYVHAGVATVELEYADGRKEVRTLNPGDNLEVPVLTWHRLGVVEGAPSGAHLTEVWLGDELREDDIERRSDDFGRA